MSQEVFFSCSYEILIINASDTYMLQRFYVFKYFFQRNFTAHQSNHVVSWNWYSELLPLMCVNQQAFIPPKFAVYFCSHLSPSFLKKEASWTETLLPFEKVGHKVGQFPYNAVGYIRIRYVLFVQWPFQELWSADNVGPIRRGGAVRRKVGISTGPCLYNSDGVKAR